jgi:hypothetical protein
LGEAAAAFAHDASLSLDICRGALEAFLTKASLPEDARDGPGEKAFLAFKLHRFIAGAGQVYTTLRAAPRNVSLEGQIMDPQDPEARLYPTRFCRTCGQEHHIVRAKARDVR